jgi:chromosome segregation ATPase
MKYYSEKLKKVYDTVEQLQAAETEYDKAHAAEIAKQKERKARAEEINKARKELVDAQDRYNDLINKFVKDYGSYHATYTDGDKITNTADLIFKIFGF